jgi:hypothetical protein
MIEICDSEREIRSILIDDSEMFERSRNDFTDLNVNLLNGGVWLKYIEDGEIKALCFFKAESAFCLDIHIHIPKNHRGKGTIKKGSEFLKWIVNNNNANYIKFNTKIPVIYRDVILFAMKLGFKREGTDRMSIIKDGKVLDMAIMGCTFEEALKCQV